MRKKLLHKILSIFIALIIGFSPLFTLVPQHTYAEDTPQEIARQEEEARREAERRAERQAREAQREAEEAAREAIEDITPTPIPPTPSAQPNPTETTTTSIDNESETSASNENTAAGSVNGTNVDNNNSGSLNNNVTTTANTGDNIVSGDPPPTETPTPTPSNKQQDPLPTCEDNLVSSNNNGGEEDSFLHEAGEVSGSENNQSGGITGSSEGGSEDAILQDNDTVTVVNSNCASLSNQQEVSTTTGGNEASGNEESQVQTGSAISDSTLINEGNKNEVTGSADAVSGENNDQVTVENNNQIYAENNVNVASTTGGNSLEDNDGQAILTTGDIDMIVTLLNILNVNITGEDFTHLIVNIFGDLNGEIDLDKIAKSLGMNEEEIQAIARNEETETQRNMEVANSNEAAVRNNVDVSASTGENTLSGNEDRTKLLTGRIKILVALINFINTNYTGTDWYFAMVNIFGNLTGDIILPDPNGFLIDETNTTNSNTSSENNLTVSNDNQATVTNNIDITGDSGSNVAYDNEDRVSQETGNVDVVTNLTNWLNVNIFGNNWVLLVVNVFGKWFGKIIGFPGQGDIEAPESGMLMVAAGGGNGQGPAVSENSSEVSDTWDVENQNQANVENNLNVTAVSGGNTTNQNEDPVTVSTGWIDISANLLNIINLNVTGKHWMLVLVNIFGDFLGDITFPGAKKPPLAQFTQESLSDTESLSSSSAEGVGGIASEDNNASEQSQTVNVVISPTPTTRVEIITVINKTDKQEENKITEVYKSDWQNQDLDNLDNENPNDSDEVKILGISLKVDQGLQQTLFLIALLSYLIALRFWAFRKSS